MVLSEEIGIRIRHWSDAGMTIRDVNTGKTYDDAVDLLALRHTYAETDTPIDRVFEEGEE